MKFSILMDIVFELLSKRRVTALYLAEKHQISTRTVYRYVEILASALPVNIARGRNGGITIADHYKLPVGFMSEEEYETVIEALEAAYERSTEEKYLQARRKISAQSKTENKERFLSFETGKILVDVYSQALPLSTIEKLRNFEEYIDEKTVAEIVYLNENNEETKRKIEPLGLVFQDGEWKTYAYCRLERALRLFSMARITFSTKTDERFLPHLFTRADIFKSQREAAMISARFTFEEKSVAAAQSWLGVENVRKKQDGKWQADVLLKDDETLAQKILGFGEQITVVFPADLKRRVIEKAKAVLAAYDQTD